MKHIIIKHKERYSYKYRDLKNPERINAIIPETVKTEDGEWIAMEGCRYWGRKVGRFIYFPFPYHLVRIIAKDVQEIQSTL